jgi:hypothetical protein
MLQYVGGSGGSRGGHGAPAFPPPPQVRHVTPRALPPGLAGSGNNGHSQRLNVTLFGRVRDQSCPTRPMIEWV